MHRLAVATSTERRGDVAAEKNGRSLPFGQCSARTYYRKEELSRRRLFPLLGSVLLPWRRLLLLLARRRWLLALCLWGTLLLMFLLHALLHALLFLGVPTLHFLELALLLL